MATLPRVPGRHDFARISVVIPTFDRAHLLRDVVVPLLPDQAIAEIIIVDDGSNDSTPQVCEELARRDPRVRPVRQENAGEAAARATGATIATAEIVLFVDDDVVTAKGTAGRHLAHHRQAPHPLVVLGYMPPQLPVRRRPGQFPVYVYRRDYERACKAYGTDSSRVLTDLWGGNFSVRRDVFLAANAVPGELAYHQDQVLGWSLRSYGCDGVFDRALAAEHRYARSPHDFFQDCQRHGRSFTLLAALTIAPEGLDLDPRAGLATPLRQLVRALAEAPEILTESMHRMLVQVGRMHWWAGETLFARILRQIESYRAFIASGEVLAGDETCRR